jgi:hypothetical protein
MCDSCRYSKRALREDPKRSNNAIAQLVGVAHPLVGDVRKVLEESSSIHRFEFRGGKSNETGHSVNCWCGKGDAEPPKPKGPKKREEPKLPISQDPELLDAIRRGIECGSPVPEEDLKKRFNTSGGTIGTARARVEGEIAGEKKVLNAVHSGELRQQFGVSDDGTPEPHVACGHGHTHQVSICDDCGAVITQGIAVMNDEPTTTTFRTENADDQAPGR